MSLFSLGKYSFLSFVKDWLLFKELCSIDSALCELKKRNLFLFNIENYVVPFLGHTSDLKLPNSFFDWIHMRGISFTDLATVGGKLRLYLSVTENSRYFFNSITSLIVNNCSLTQLHNDLLLLVSNCINLETLILTGGSEIILDGNLFAEKNISLNCSKMTKLNITHFASLSVWSIETLVGNCDGLVDLNLSGCVNLSDDCMLKIVARSGLILRNIRLTGCIELTDSCLVAIAEHCLNLELLAVSALKMTNVGVEAVLKNCKQVTTLELCGNRNGYINKQTLKLVGEYCPQLTSINVSGNAFINDIGLDIVFRQCPFLTEIDISDSPCVTSMAIDYLADYAYNVRRIKFGGKNADSSYLLTVIVILLPKFAEITKFCYNGGLLEGIRNPVGSADTKIDSRCRASLMNSVAKMSPNLHTLEYKCANGRHVIVENWYPARFAKLRVFRCCDVPYYDLTIDDFELYMVAKYATLLEEVDFSDCRCISNDGVVAVFEANRKLTKVVLNNCVSLTDECVVTLANTCRDLECLHLSGCVVMTDAAVEALGDHSRCLVELDVHHTQITATVIDKLRTRCLGLRSVVVDILQGNE